MSTGRYVVERLWNRWQVVDLADNTTAAGPYDTRDEALDACTQLNTPPPRPQRQLTLDERTA